LNLLAVLVRISKPMDVFQKTEVDRRASRHRLLTSSSPNQTSLWVTVAAKVYDRLE